MRIVLGLLADAANTTADGKVNILGVFSVVHAPSAPLSTPPFVVVLNIQGEAHDRGKSVRVRLTLTDPDMRPVLDTVEISRPFPLTSIGLEPNFVTLLYCPPLLLPAYGDYNFEVYVDGNRLGEIPFVAAPLSSVGAPPGV